MCQFSRLGARGALLLFCLWGGYAEESAASSVKVLVLYKPPAHALPSAGQQKSALFYIKRPTHTGLLYKGREQ